MSTDLDILDGIAPCRQIPMVRSDTVLDGIAPCRQIPMVRSDTVRYLIVSHATSVSVSTILFSKPRIVTDENRPADFFVKLQTFLRIRM